MFTLKIKTGNAAFEGRELWVIAELLAEVASRLRSDVNAQDGRPTSNIGSVIRDENGNTVGKWELK